MQILRLINRNFSHKHAKINAEIQYEKNNEIKLNIHFF